MTETKQQVQPCRSGTLPKTIVTVGFVAAGAVYGWKHLAEFRDFDWPSATAIAVVAAGFVASVLFRAVYNYVAGRQLGADLGLSESFMLSAVVTASNVILPANPGAAFRAIYMKKVHAFPYAYFAGATALYFVITILMVSVISVGLLLLIYYELGYFRLDLFVALPAVALAAGLSLALRRGSSQTGNENLWTAFRSAYLGLIADKALLHASIAIVTANFVVASFVWIVVLRDQDASLAVLEGLLFAGSQIASGLINLTPGAAGFQEVVGIYVGRAFALSAVELFAVLLWVRLVRTVAAIVLGVPCAVVLRARTSRADGRGSSA